MNWDSISAVAEAVGATGVIITLIYLAVQIRQNTAQMRDSAKDTRLDAFDRTVEAFSRYREYLTREDNSELYAKGLDFYATLSPGEKFRFRAIIEEYFFAFHGLFGRLNEGRYDQSLWNAQLKGATALLRTKGGREWWIERRHAYTLTFIEEMERIAETDSERLTSSNV